MHRFTTKETKYADKKSRTKYLYLLVPVFIIIFWIVVSSVDESTVSRQKESLENAINRDIIHCYAVEGYYPPSLDYLVKHYGLTYDHDTFIVDYQPVGANIRPEVTILVMEP